MLQKKLKDDRIFGYDNFDDFNRKYFKKELVAFEDFHKVRQLKYARVKYNNRHGQQQMMTQYSPSKSPKKDSPTLNNGMIMQMMGQNRLQNNETE